MNVGSVNNVNFKSSNAFEGFTPPKFTSVPVNNTVKDEADSFENKSNTKVDYYRENFKNPEWNKKYIPEADIIHMKQKDMIDGTEFEIHRDGQVVQVGTWQNPEVILEKDEESKKLFDRLDDNTSEKHLLTQETPKRKTNKFNETVAKVWKFFSATGRMTRASVKGLLYSTATFAGLLGGAWIYKALPKAFEKGGPRFIEIVKHPLKHIGRSGKNIAGIGASFVLAYHLIAGKLDTNQITAVIEHKMHVGHRDN